MILRGWVAFLILSMAIAAPAAGSAKHSCMTTHMKDAIKINRERGAWYSQLSDGQSQRITNLLIGMEQRLLLGSPIIDVSARPYQKAGVPIVCEDVIDMSFTPAFRAQNPAGPVAKQSYRRVLVDVVHNKLSEKLKNDDFQGMAWLADQYVQQLEKQPRFNCLVRHMLESVRRTALLAPRHEAAALRKGLGSPRTLSKLILKSHLDLLNKSARIDILAAPLQADGLMIVCQDVPHIPRP
ncbi:hypothetical protein AZI86_02665 [Bdellovibrio bacteriovorus]|uniref:Uncharacterized protein n=1 Tax=Bdellovibrio bacteriovorus TaxID=959 RepID=A0A150WNW8_BDEBC|nr:hypothetical protein [Bdellovibrio bacteriovorus]KYG65989.1 hypothetical protein AZI86_02665 [Bdellovibrio bacteriovorus]